MVRTTHPSTVMIVDDELHNMLWMMDYLTYKGLTVLTAENVNEALQQTDGKSFRALIVDLNIPVFPPLEFDVESKGIAYKAYPGLYVADRARNMGYRSRQVLLYSVHRDPLFTDTVARLGITYIMKGRPQEIKKEIDAVLSFDPSSS